MRNCRRADELRTALAAEEPLYDELVHHARSCADCTAAIAQYRRFEQGLHAAVNQLITDAVPPETLSAARLGQYPRVKRGLPSLAMSGLGAAAIVLFAVVGVASTGAGVLGTLNSEQTLAADPVQVQSDFSDCYIEDAIVSGAGAEGQSITVTVEHCLAGASGLLENYGIVVQLNRGATDTTACLRARGWDVEPVLEPGGRFLVPPASAPAGTDEQRYVRDAATCAEEQQ